MDRFLEIAADNLRLWREGAAQAGELCALQAQRTGREIRSQEELEMAAHALWHKEKTRASEGEIAEKLAFLRGIVQAHAIEEILGALPLPTLSPAPTAPRVVFLDSAFGREALRHFEKLLPHPLPVTAHSFTAVCEELAGDRADFALLPLEDSREGRFLHLYEEIDRFELHITHSCEVSYADEGRSVLMALLSRRYTPSVQAEGERLLACAVLEEHSHALSDLLIAAKLCGLSLRRIDTLPTSYGENIAIYHPLFCAHDEEGESLFLLYLSLFQPRARATARYIHLKEISYE